MEVDEASVSAAVRDRLGAMPTGADPDAAFDLLTLYVYTQSELRATLSSRDARNRVEAVAAFISTMRAHHEEWNVTIVPIGDVPIEELRAWKPRIDEAVGMAAAVRLAWSTAVLARSRH